VIVVDASAVVELLLGTAAGHDVARRLEASDFLPSAPQLLDAEVAQALRRFARRGEIGPQRGGEALADLALFPLRRYPYHFLLSRMWELCDNLTAYDAAYVALAEALDATLLTRDGRIEKAPGHRARVEVV
jgi:predicted nucleic acid-binding protein